MLIATTPLDDPEPTRRLLTVHTDNDAGRAETQAFVQRIYADRFGAQVTAFAPVLLALRDAGSGELLAAAGYRRASEGPLFLERYLDAPVEHLLAPHGAAVRSGVFEVGHLAAARSGEGRRLIFMMGTHLAQQGAQWVVSTLTQELRHLFVRLGVTPLALGRADPAALGDDASQWGRYYEHRPVVLAGQLQQALRLLSRRRPQELS